MNDGQWNKGNLPSVKMYVDCSYHGMCVLRYIHRVDDGVIPRDKLDNHIVTRNPVIQPAARFILISGGRRRQASDISRCRPLQRGFGLLVSPCLWFDTILAVIDLLHVV
jgi:hypothetical protein